MLMYIASKVVGMLFGLLYPAYASFLAVKNKDVRGYVQWMMYWIVFAFYTFLESFTDTFLGPWFPFYYEFKICFLLWLMAPQTGGAGFLYRRFLHPKLVKYEPEIDLCLVNIQHQTSSFIFQWASKAISVVVQTLSDTLRRGVIKAASQDVVSQHILRTLSLSALHHVEPTQSTSCLQVSASVGTTPMNDLDMDEFLGNDQQTMNFNISSSSDSNRNRVFSSEEEGLGANEVDVEVLDNTPPPPKAAKSRRRKKESEVGRVYETRRRRPRGEERVRSPSAEVDE